MRKIKNASTTRDNVSILHYALGKNASQLRFTHVLLAFYSGFTRVLLAFLFTNANQKHSVIGALHILIYQLMDFGYLLDNVVNAIFLLTLLPLTWEM